MWPETNYLKVGEMVEFASFILYGENSAPLLVAQKALFNLLKSLRILYITWKAEAFSQSDAIERF